MYQQHCNPCMRNGLQDECGHSLRQMSYSYGRQPIPCRTNFQVYSSRSRYGGSSRSLRGQNQPPTGETGSNAEGNDSTEDTKKADVTKGYTDSEPYSLPYRSTYYPAGPFGPRIELCPYVPLTHCS